MKKLIKKKVVMGVISLLILIFLITLVVILSSKENFVGEAIRTAGKTLQKPIKTVSSTTTKAPPKIGTGVITSPIPLSPELSSSLIGSGPVYTPIIIKPFYLGEKEQFGYNPHFVPNSVTFDLNNRPFIRTHEGILQILEKGGTWTKVDLVAEAKKSFDQKMKSIPNWNINWHGYTTWFSNTPNGPLIKEGNQVDERVVFDNSGDAYTILHTAAASNINLHMLLHSKDNGKTWEVYAIPDTEDGGEAILEHQDGYNQLTSPPGILINNYPGVGKDGKVISSLKYLDVNKNPDGTLQFNKVQIADDSYLGAGPSSFPNQMVTSGDLTHFVYIGGKFQQDKNNPDSIIGISPFPNYVMTYIKTYNHKTKELSPPILLGPTSTSTAPNPAPDDHEYPGICIDSKGIINVIIGSHGRQFRYTHSLVPNNIEGGWTEPVGIGEPDDDQAKGEYSYVELVCDSQDVVHVVARSSGIGNRYKLVYLQKKSGQENWEVWNPYQGPVPGENLYQSLKHKTILYNWHPAYGNYYHKLNLDRKGRLFVNYVFFIDNLYSDEVEAYQKKWSAEILVKDDPACVNNPFDRSKRKSDNCPGLDCTKDLSPDTSPECIDVCKEHLCWYANSVKAHDPAIVMSEDGGNSWQLVTTQDFLDGMK